MRDPVFLTFITAHLIDKAGGKVTIETHTATGRKRFMAGPVPLAGEAVAHLINDRWLVPDGPRNYHMPNLPLWAEVCDRCRTEEDPDSIPQRRAM